MSTCYNTTVINAPMDAVWEMLSDFHDMTWALGAVDKCEKIGSQSDQALLLANEVADAVDPKFVGMFKNNFPLIET